VYVNLTKDQIKDAPEFDEDRYRDSAYRDELGGYYGPGGVGYRDPS
jgi:stress response protein YsnF